MAEVAIEVLLTALNLRMFFRPAVSVNKFPEEPLVLLEDILTESAFYLLFAFVYAMEIPLL